MLAAYYDRQVHKPRAALETSWPLLLNAMFRSYSSEELAVVYHTYAHRTDAIMKRNDGEYAIDDERIVS